MLQRYKTSVSRSILSNGEAFPDHSVYTRHPHHLPPATLWTHFISLRALIGSCADSLECKCCESRDCVRSLLYPHCLDQGWADYKPPMTSCWKSERKEGIEKGKKESCLYSNSEHIFNIHINMQPHGNPGCALFLCSGLLTTLKPNKEGFLSTNDLHTVLKDGEKGNSLMVLSAKVHTF